MTGRDCNDAEIVQAVLAGDQEQFGRLVERYQRMIGNVAYRSGLNRASIADFTSEVFLRTYHKLDTYNPRYRFSTWLYTIALNMARDRLRRPARETAALDEIAPPVIDAPTPEEAHATRQQAERVRQALARLPDHYREVLVLRYLQDLDVAEIAQVTDSPEGSVKVRLMRGRHRLQKVLEALGAEEAEEVDA